MEEELLDLSIKKGKIIKQQSLSGEVRKYYQKPVLEDKTTLKNESKDKKIKGVPKITVDKNIVIEKSNKNAENYKNRVFMCDDGKFYVSKKNKKGKYVWKIFSYV